MSKPSGNQVTSTVMNDQQKEVYNRFKDASHQEYSPTMPGYEQQQKQATDLTGQGLGALGGDPHALATFANPYQKQVIDNLGQSYDRQRSQAALGANDAATQAGAFGGDRHALLVGERQGALDRSQMEQTGQLMYQGYNDQQQRAAQAANLGLGAGDYYSQLAKEKRDWELRNANVAQSGVNGMPYGTSTPTSKNVLGGIAGGAAAGGAIGGPIGAGIGGGIGFLGSVF